MVLPSGYARPAAVITVVVFSILAVFLRQGGIAKAETIWAEDGPVFAACAYERSVIPCLTEPYAGYYHTVPRLAAAVAVPFGDPSGLPLRLTMAAALLAAAAAGLAARAVAEATGSPATGLVTGAALVLVYPAGIEVLGNLTNLHWVLFAAAATVLICAWTGRRIGRADLVLVALTALSSPFAVLLPVLAIGGVISRARNAAVCALIALVATIPQLATMLTSDRAFAPIVWAVAPWDSFTWAAKYAWFGPGYGALKLAVLALLVAIGVALIGCLRYDRPAAMRSLLASTGLLVTAGSTLVIAQVRNGALGYRHLLPAAALTVIAMALGAASVRMIQANAGPDAGGAIIPARVRRAGASLLLVALVATFGSGFALSFRLTSLASTGPDVPVEIQARRADCGGDVSSIQVEISPLLDPPAWYVPIPCSGLHGD